LTQFAICHVGNFCAAGIHRHQLAHHVLGRVRLVVEQLDIRVGQLQLLVEHADLAREQPRAPTTSLSLYLPCWLKKASDSTRCRR